MTRPSLATVVAILLALLTVVVYSLGVSNGLVFDDARLTDGTILNGYGSLWPLKQRLLSYGSFVWMDHLTAGSLPLQRMVNLMLHLGTAWLVYRLMRTLLLRIDSPGSAPQTELNPAQQAGLSTGMVLFVLSPAAVYAVGYLVQRSIVMATLFSALACLAFVNGLQTSGSAKMRWLLGSALAFVLAILSKEQAFLLALLSVPLYVFMVRPSWRKTLGVVLGALLASLLAVALLTVFYPNLAAMIGQAFDDTSQQLVAQLDKQRPGAAAQIYPLSALNQSALFFYYGFLWLIPVTGWMSIDMRPPFPLTLSSFPHLAGALTYVVVFVASVWAVLRRSDVWGFIGLCLLFPLVLFWTEFATAWVQDPMVLYRSYLWAIPLPGLVAVALVASGFSSKTLYGVAVALALLFSALAAERVMSMQSPMTVWTDAVEKTDLKGPANAVGRYRAFLNRGAQYLDRFSADLAITDFRNAHALGEPTGGALFNMGVAEQALKKHPDALRSFTQAEAAGYTDGPLYYHRGESLLATGQLADAALAYSEALKKTLAPAVASQTRTRLAEIHMRMGRYVEATQVFEALVKSEPTNLRHQTGLGMAHLGARHGAAALDVFKQVLSHAQDAKATALAHYGQAIAHAMLNQPVEARQAMAQAVQLDPQNPSYRQLQQQWAKEVTLPRGGS